MIYKINQTKNAKASSKTIDIEWVLNKDKSGVMVYDFKTKSNPKRNYLKDAKMIIDKKGCFVIDMSDDGDCKCFEALKTVEAKSPGCVANFKEAITKEQFATEFNYCLTTPLNQSRYDQFCPNGLSNRPKANYHPDFTNDKKSSGEQAF